MASKIDLTDERAIELLLVGMALADSEFAKAFPKDELSHEDLQRLVIDIQHCAGAKVKPVAVYNQLQNMGASREEVDGISYADLKGAFLQLLRRTRRMRQLVDSMKNAAHRFHAGHVKPDVFLERMDKLNAAKQKIESETPIRSEENGKPKAGRKAAGESKEEKAMGQRERPNEIQKGES